MRSAIDVWQIADAVAEEGQSGSV